ncbi:hypothetical protein B1C78_08830 [Thioalkalivibrio denitrificans]|uniref:Uncharacterized protein n=1 Tax=Thioalkalivibrio denitrificans TaxID=108003 RepID=A0A1V3NH87_9GAMM|nr:hypothetical protein B1C78_08830 [Thioalkalivibrio denitrificans]
MGSFPWLWWFRLTLSTQKDLFLAQILTDPEDFMDCDAIHGVYRRGWMTPYAYLRVNVESDGRAGPAPF